MRGARSAILLSLTAALVIAGRHGIAGPPSGTPASASEPDQPSTANVGGHGSTILVDAHGLLIAERNVGAVIRANRDGLALASLPMSRSLGELVHDGNGLVFVADRGADRVVRIAPGDGTGHGLAENGSFAVREPHGLALTPDGQTLLVTSVANHELLAFSTATFELRWRVRLAPEPRPVAVSPDGAVAVVGFLSSGALAIVELGTPEPRVSWRALDPREHVDIEIEEHEYKGKSFTDVGVSEVDLRSRFRVPVETGRRYVRNVAALYFEGDRLVAAHQLATPQLERMPSAKDRSSYGGGDRDVEPIVHQVSFLSDPGLLGSWVESADVDISQPQAIVSGVFDRMFVGGRGDDRIAVFEDGKWDGIVELPERCGIDGMATDGARLWIHCVATRRVIEAFASTDERGFFTLTFEILPELAADPRPELVVAGAELFIRPDWRMSGSGMACANCHPEGRSDGLSWRLGPEIMQTPILADRIRDTEPYKWTGKDSTLHASFRETIRRLGGEPSELRSIELGALAAYLRYLSPPVPRDVSDPEAAARGRALFEEQSCDACHEGPKLTDASQHRLDTPLKKVDTPSLIGLGHSPPYYHDGSAQDLWALLTDKASIHDMADTSELDDAQLRDLIAYLEGL